MTTGESKKLRCLKCDSELRLDMRVYKRILRIDCTNPECGYRDEVHLDATGFDKKLVPGLVGPEQGKPTPGLRG